MNTTSEAVKKDEGYIGWVPLWEVEGNIFFLLNSRCVYADKEEAKAAEAPGMLEMVTFSALNVIGPIGAIELWDGKKISYVTCHIPCGDIAVVKGPILESAQKQFEKEEESKKNGK